MGDSKDTVESAKTFIELRNIIAENTQNYCRPLLRQRGLYTQKSSSSWAKRNIINEAKISTERFLKDAKINDQETRDALLDSVLSDYRNLA